MQLSVRKYYIQLAVTLLKYIIFVITSYFLKVLLFHKAWVISSQHSFIVVIITAVMVSQLKLFTSECLYGIKITACRQSFLKDGSGTTSTSVVYLLWRLSPASMGSLCCLTPAAIKRALNSIASDGIYAQRNHDSILQPHTSTEVDLLCKCIFMYQNSNQIIWPHYAKLPKAQLLAAVDL